MEEPGTRQQEEYSENFATDLFPVPSFPAPAPGGGEQNMLSSRQAPSVFSSCEGAMNQQLVLATIGAY